jgi:hypothetical protein
MMALNHALIIRTISNNGVIYGLDIYVYILRILKASTNNYGQIKRGVIGSLNTVNTSINQLINDILWHFP